MWKKKHGESERGEGGRCKNEIGQKRPRGSARLRREASGAPQGLVLVPAGSSGVEKALLIRRELSPFSEFLLAG